MADVLIAYNSNPEEPVSSFFDACFSKVRQASADNGLAHTSFTGDKLTETDVIGAMPEHSLCVAIVHGDTNGIVNEADEYFISTRTTNYVFENKGLYAISCHCGQNLKDELMRIGMKLFIGYKDELKFFLNDEDFVDCATEGLAALFEGRSLGQAQKEMEAKYYKTIDETNDWLKRSMLFHNLTNLLIDGNSDLTLKDLG